MAASLRQENLHVDPADEHPPGPPNSPASMAVSPSSIPIDGGPVHAYLSLNGECSNTQCKLAQSLEALSLKQTEEGNRSKDKLITVAISGCSSSGKTTLTLLLAEIFTTPGMATNSSEGSERFAKKNLLIHQDDLFVHKTHCPLISFQSTPLDAEFCQKTLEKDNIGMYSVSCIGPRANTQYTEHSPSTSLDAQLNTSATSSFLPCLGRDAGRDSEPSFFRIFGPDTDCVEAINFKSMLETITHAKATGRLEQQGDKTTSDGCGKMPAVHVTQKDVADLNEKYATLITEMKEVVDVFVKEQSIKNAETNFGGNLIKSKVANYHDGKASLHTAFCFVDGFLLFSQQDATSTPSGSKKDAATRIHNPEQVANNEKEFEKELDELETFSTMDARYEATSRIAMQNLMRLFDVKLFLPTSKEISRSRRSGRCEYVDYPVGQRHPGQMWKSDGYFEHVTWKNFLKEHKWLVKQDGCVKEGVVDGGVVVHQEIDASVENTVKWAVEVILAELGKMEQIARGAKAE